MYWVIAACSMVAFLVTLASTPKIIEALKKAGRVGRDMNKEGHPIAVESGGFGVLFGFSVAVLSFVGLSTFFGMEFNTGYILASLCTILLMGLVGVFDDFCNIRQSVKAFLPLFAALPFVAVKAGSTVINLGPFGIHDLGLFYIFILIPLGIAGASNLTNMFAGFNGLEAGMGVVLLYFSGVYSLFFFRQVEAAVISFSMAFALLAFLAYNWYPAKAFIGDVGTLIIGASFASSIIIGNYEFLGVLMMSPYIADFFVKAYNRMPSGGWWGELEDGVLVCRKKPVHLAQVLMKAAGGMSERMISLSFIAMEVIACLLVGVLIMVK